VSSTATVRRQAELDAALANPEVTRIDIRSEPGVWLDLFQSGSATVWAYDSATVRAYGSATVRAYGSATVRATPHVAVHLHDADVTVDGGTVIDVTKINDDPDAWLAHHGIAITDDKATLYKAVLDDWTTGRGPQWTYQPGNTVTAEDYERTAVCGNGLHLGPTPHHSAAYLPNATRYVACEVEVGEIVLLGDKVKVRSVRVLHEVHYDGREVAS
jgi:hypothetical protein